MILTKEIIESVGKRSPLIREAMVQAGDKVRISAMKKAILSIGACELTDEEIRENKYRVQEKKFPFTLQPLKYVLLDEDEFAQFPRINSPVAFEVAHIRNGAIGILSR